MFKNNNISLICRIICLLTFVSVILFVDNLYVLGILAIIVFLLVRLDNNIFISILMVLNFIGFMVGYTCKYYILIRLLLVISYSYYYLKDNVKYKKIEIFSNYDIIYDKLFKRNQKKLKNIKEGEVIDKDIIKNKTEYDLEEFKNRGFVKTYQKNNNISMQEIFYVLFHLFLLFISIIIGSCVI